jgi:hypothetical protein
MRTGGLAGMHIRGYSPRTGLAGTGVVVVEEEVVGQVAGGLICTVRPSLVTVMW